MPNLEFYWEFIPVRCTLQECYWVPYLTATNIAGASAPGSYLIWCFILCRLVLEGRDKSWSTTNLEWWILNSNEFLFRCAAPSKKHIGCLTWRLQIFPVLAHLAPTWFDVSFSVGWFQRGVKNLDQQPILNAESWILLRIYCGALHLPRNILGALPDGYKYCRC